nr:uncharacterized protein LOC109154753 [Ipomoea batatas]GME14548.1 uncharacterized protein LOC109154753 [Ipomoea batatas]
MASQNPFITFFTSEDRLTLARKIVQGISDFNPAACVKIALTFALNPSLMDDLTMKDSRRIMELAKLCSEVPWTLPESAVLDPDQSAPPTQALAESRNTAAAHDATSDVAPRSAVTTADALAPTATNVAQRTATPLLPQAAPPPQDLAAQSATAPADVAVLPLPQATPAAPMPQVSVDLPQVRNVAASQPVVHGVHSTAASSDLLFIAPPGSFVSQVDASKISSTKIGVPSVLCSDKKGKEDKVLLPFSSLIYGILCKQGFRKHPQEEELSPTCLYSIDRRLFFKSHLDDCSTFKSAVVPEGESTRSCVSVDFAAVSARVLTTQSILKSLKSTVVQMEKVLLEDTKLLQSFETDAEDLDSAR